MQLRSPKFGNTFALDTATIVNRNASGQLRTLHPVGRLQFESFEVEIEALSDALKEALIQFFISVAGQEINYSDHEGRTWLGLITSPDIEFVQNGRNCHWSTKFSFEGVIIG